MVRTLRSLVTLASLLSAVATGMVAQQHTPVPRDLVSGDLDPGDLDPDDLDPDDLDPDGRLAREVRRIVAHLGIDARVAVIDVRTGRSMHVNGDKATALASTFKLPLAITVLRRVQAGTLALDEEVAIEGLWRYPYGSRLAQMLPEPGVRLSVANLLALTMTVSDNAATDALLERIGGGAAIEREMAALGFEGITVRGTVRDNVARYDGVDVSDWQRADWERYLAVLRALPAADTAAAARSYLSDPPVVATPQVMARLLSACVRGELLDEEHTRRCIALLDAAENATRLGGRRPPGIDRPAHKTGTLLGGGEALVAAVGMFRLPRSDELVVAIYARGQEADVRDLETAIGEIARAAVDYRMLASK